MGRACGIRGPTAWQGQAMAALCKLFAGSQHVFCQNRHDITTPRIGGGGTGDKEPRLPLEDQPIDPPYVAAIHTQNTRGAQAASPVCTL